MNFRAFGVFLANLSAPILVQQVPCPCFPLFIHHFYKKLSLYIHIQNFHMGLGLGFEFGPFVSPYFVDITIVTDEELALK